MKTIPYESGHPFIGFLPEYRKDFASLSMRLLAEHGSIYSIKVGPLKFIYLAHPDYIRHILQENYKNYKKGIVSDIYLRPILGNGLLVSEGEFWRKQRKLIQPAFHKKQILTIYRLLEF